MAAFLFLKRAKIRKKFKKKRRKLFGIEEGKLYLENLMKSCRMEERKAGGDRGWKE